MAEPNTHLKPVRDALPDPQDATTFICRKCKGYATQPILCTRGDCPTEMTVRFVASMARH